MRVFLLCIFICNHVLGNVIWKDEVKGDNPNCPDACYTCTVWDGSSVCKYWCSASNNCGTTDAHKQGGTDCTQCDDTDTTTDTFTPTSNTTPTSGEDMQDTKWRVIYIDYVVNWDDITLDIKAAVDHGFNVINLAFFLSDKPWDVAESWTWLTEEQRANCLQYVHDHNAYLVISAGGATYHVEDMMQTGNTQFCTDAGLFARQYGFDGVDLDFEFYPGNSAPLKDGTGVAFIVDCTKAVREIIGMEKILSHAPQAPYLSTWAGNKMGYLNVYKEVPDMIDFLNIQYYNQGGAYSSYETLFIQNPSFPQSAVFEIINNGVPMHKVLVGKPVKRSHAGTGYVDPKTLHDWGEKAFEQLGWFGGFMGWMYETNDQTVDTWEEELSEPFDNTHHLWDEPTDFQKLSQTAHTEVLRKINKTRSKAYLKL